MYRLMISFSDDELSRFGLSRNKEYLLPNADEVCKVINRLSHLNPIVTLCQISVLSADDVLKDFELKEV